MSSRGDTTAPFAPGDVVAGKYRIERVLGEGGMGVVVKALHLALDEPVAIKFLRPEIARDPEAAERFAREAKAALRIKSEHVSKVLDIDRLADGTPYMVMEFLDGIDLDERLEQRGPLPVPEAVDAIIQACAALSEAHAQGIIHRDIKPANLFETRDARGGSVIKVLDFGISKITGERIGALTAPDAAMGSTAFMSPEQLVSSRDVDRRADVYALGVSLYELITAQPAFDGDSVAQVVAAVLRGQYVPITTHRPDLPTALVHAINRAMSPDCEDRYPDVVSFAHAIAPYASQRGSATFSRLVAVPLEMDTLVSTEDGQADAVARPAPAITAPAHDQTSEAVGWQQARTGQTKRSGSITTQAVVSPREERPPSTSRWIWLVGAAAALMVAATATLVIMGDERTDAPTPAAESAADPAPERDSSTDTVASAEPIEPAPDASSVAAASASATATSAQSATAPTPIALPPPRVGTPPVPKAEPKPPAPPPSQPPPNIKDSWP